MTEIPFHHGDPPPQEDRIAPLKGKVPEKFLYQMHQPTGLHVDYSNTYNGVLMHLRIFLPNVGKETSRSMQLTDDHAQKVRDLIGESTKTYTEYWQQRVSTHNTVAKERGTPSVDEEEMLQLLVTEQPGAEELDALATSARSLATANISSEELVESYVRFAAKARGIIWGDEAREQEALMRFGLSPKPPEKSISA